MMYESLIWEREKDKWGMRVVQGGKRDGTVGKGGGEKRGK